MKLVIVFLIFVLCSMHLWSQTTYESPYVFEGKTFQLELPEGFYELHPSGNRRKVVFYSSDTTAEFQHVNLDSLEMDLLVVSHIKAKEISMEEMVKKMVRRLDMDDSDVNVTFILEPTIVTRNGVDFAILGVTGELDELKIESYYLAMTKFGDYFFGLTFIGPNKNSIVSTNDELFDVLDSFQIYATEKENQLE